MPLSRADRAGVHAQRTIRPDGQLPVLVAEIPDVVGEEIDAEAERRHAAELVLARHLAMLERVTVIAACMSAHGALERVERGFRGLVAIDVDVHLDAGAVQGGDKLLEFARAACSRCRSDAR